MSNYQITTGGAIVEIKDDGSVRQLGHINAQGQLEGVTSTPTSRGKTDKGWIAFTWILGIVAIALGVICYVLYFNYNSELYRNSNLSSEVNSLSREVNSQRNTIDELNQKYNSLSREYDSFKAGIGSRFPLLINDVKIGNTYSGGNIETTFGGTIYSSQTMYLTPQISYTGMRTGSINLKVKLFRPNGYLSTGTSSPSGYSFSSDVYVTSGESRTTSLSGWGNSEKGHWKSGNYRIEIWYGSTCLANKTFTIY